MVLENEKANKNWFIEIERTIMGDEITEEHLVDSVVNMNDFDLILF